MVHRQPRTESEAEADERTRLLSAPAQVPEAQSARTKRDQDVALTTTSTSTSTSTLLSPIRRVLFVALVSACSFAFTQTSLIYAFRVMTCEDHFGHHRQIGQVLLFNAVGGEAGSLGGGVDRCAIPIVEARTARAIALMSTMTTFCSILNLFVTGYWFKKLGIKMAMFQQTFWAALRSLTQIYALSIGGQFGINLITITQAINILGSGGGYELSSLAYIAQLCGAEERTGMFGVLMGVRMLGAAIGYIFGGMAFDYGGLLLPFQIAFCLLVFTTIFAALFLPYIDPTPPDTLAHADGSEESEESIKEKRSRSFLYPLKIFIPRRSHNRKGRDWNLTFLGMGAFVSVLATGYVGMGLQLVATNVFGFKPGPTGLMLSLTLAMRAFFLTILFPRIIAKGRLFLSSRGTKIQPTAPPIPTPLPPTATPTPVTTEASNLLPPNPEPEPEPVPVDTAHGSRFDLYFLQSSILLDGILTSLVAFAEKGWEMYLAAAVLPFASGTGSAVKGVAMDLVETDEKADALSGIALIEKLAQVSTISLFGFVFSALSEIGMPTAVFLANGAIAIVGFVLLLCVKMPKAGNIALA